MTATLYALVASVVAILDDLGIPYAVGGSLASSLVGEPRSTNDGDVAIHVDRAQGALLVARLSERFYVPAATAAAAIETQSSFNVLDLETGSKVDLFVLGDNVLDRMQIARRTRRAVPGLAIELWVTATEDQILRKLDWYRIGEGTSDRQWRDICAIGRVQYDVLDMPYLLATAEEVGLSDLLEQALREAGGSGSSGAVS
jgi:hypothetical protein